MKTKIFALISAAAFIGLLGFREWLVRQQISLLQTTLSDELREQFQSATRAERLQHLISANVVFERFFEPMLLEANRLVWPPSRQEVLTSWRRQLNTQLDELSQKRQTDLSAQLKNELDGIRQSAGASLARLYQVLEKEESLLGTPESCRTSVQDEMKLMKEASAQRDNLTLSEIKGEGAARLKSLSLVVKRMSKRELGEFLSSGRFVREIQQPVVEKILQLKDVDLRKSAWQQFKTKSENILMRRATQISQNERKQRDSLKSFDPVAEANFERQQLSMPAPQNALEAPIALPPAVPYEPQLEAPATDDDVPSNPSDADR